MRQGDMWSKMMWLAVTMSISDNLDFRKRRAIDVVTLKSLHDTLVKESIAVLGVPGSLKTVYPNVQYLA